MATLGLTTFGMTDDELTGLQKCLSAAVDGRCIPEWEFEPLIGCTRQQARELVETDLSQLDLDSPMLDHVVALLSALSGAAQPASNDCAPHDEVDVAELHGLLSKLLACGEERPELVSSVSLRVPEPARIPTKRGA